MFLGGSTTETVVVSEELRFPALVSTLLEERGRRVNTLNAGKSGLSTQDSLNLLLNHIVYDDPDIAVMMHAANDIGWLAGTGDLRARQAGPMDLVTVFRWLGQVASVRSSVRCCHLMCGIALNNPIDRKKEVSP